MSGGGLAYGGAVYNWHLHKLMNLSTRELKAILDGWNKRSLLGKLGGHLNPIVGWGAKLEATRDLLAMHNDPHGEIAKRIGWKLDDWRVEQATLATT